jgi:hypothetical protein
MLVVSIKDAKKRQNNVQFLTIQWYIQPAGLEYQDCYETQKNVQQLEFYPYSMNITAAAVDVAVDYPSLRGKLIQFPPFGSV